MLLLVLACAALPGLQASAGQDGWKTDPRKEKIAEEANGFRIVQRGQYRTRDKLPNARYPQGPAKRGNKGILVLHARKPKEAVTETTVAATERGRAVRPLCQGNCFRRRFSRRYPPRYQDSPPPLHSAHRHHREKWRRQQSSNQRPPARSASVYNAYPRRRDEFPVSVYDAYPRDWDGSRLQRHYPGPGYPHSHPVTRPHRYPHHDRQHH